VEGKRRRALATPPLVPLLAGQNCMIFNSFNENCIFKGFLGANSIHPQQENFATS